MEHLHENRRQSRRKPLLLCLGWGVFALAFASGGAAFGQTKAYVECSSVNNSRKVCSTEKAIDSLRVVERKSNRSCVEGTSYGVAGNAVWVDKGCSARFEVTYRNTAKPSTGAAKPPQNRPGASGGRGDDQRGNDQRDFEVTSLYCAGDGTRRKECSVGGEIRSIEVVNQRSQTRCRKDVNYGYDGDAVWVSGGCAADFEVRYVPDADQGGRRNGVRPGGDNSNRSGVRPGVGDSNRSVYTQETVRLNCGSSNYSRKECAVDGGIVSVTLVETKSKTACVKDGSYGYGNQALWVDRGCSGVFDVTFRRTQNSGRGGGAITTQNVSCKSTNYARKNCVAGGRITDLRIINNKSQTRCQKDVNYGYNDDTIWVDKGCEADFEVSYRP
ncbi:MAG: DUF3011 domain-containing protein [Acidobacteriota bacterium]|jgi:hypothetical protein|nr:DUF3011 domain-containing protein [Acidobacteriota bacterium]